MERIAQKALKHWIESSRRKPLVVRGARQTGKTWLVDQLGKEHFDEYVKIDLEKRRDLHIQFAGDISPHTILKGLEFAAGKRIIPGKTLLFLDEIQACPRALTALRYFYEEMPGLHVIAAGSLLEFALGDISVPVGRIQYLSLYPMNFYEYLCAVGREVPAEYISRNQSEVPASVQEQLLNELRTYFFIGGMPEAVEVYRDTNSILEVFSVQSEIVDTYKEDFAKYASRADKTCLDAVLLSAAQQVGNQIIYTHLDKGHSIPTIHNAFDLLTKAQVIHKITSCSPSGLPLGATANQKRFKAALLDIGLMQRLCQVPVDIEMHTLDLFAIYRGKLAEQFVAQELRAVQQSELHYWARERRGSSAEVDFLIVRKGKIYPVEVKSGKGGSLRSLHMILKTFPNCPRGLVLYSGTYAELPEQNITFLPLYCAGAVGDPQTSMNMIWENTEEHITPVDMSEEHDKYLYGDDKEE